MPDPAGPAAHPLLQLTVDRTDGAVVLQLSGRMDAEGVREIQDRFESAADGTAPILIDLSGVAFMDSLGIALLVRLAKRLRRHAVPVAVIPGPGPVARLLGLARVDRILNVVFTRDDAWGILKATPSG
jgi:anti-sigma B factor antagonist